MRHLPVIALLACTSGALLSAQAQPPAPNRGGPQAGAATVETDPIRCWWRTSTGSVRIGEPFTLVLTCAVIENESVTVVPDQSRLEPSVLQIPPFEVVEGTHATDLRTPDRRFFQYQYTLRLLKDDVIGSDVKLPALQVNYRVRTSVQRGAAIQGSDHVYVLPAQSIRVLSLVPADATDIRDVPVGTFGDLDARSFRASTLLVGGAVLVVLGLVMTVLALVALTRGGVKREARADRLISDSAVLRGVQRELSAVERQRQDEGWTADLVGRALAALRIAAAYAASGRASQRPADAHDEPAPGHVRMRKGFLAAKGALVSGSATPGSVSHEAAGNGMPEDRRSRLDELHTALSRFGAARYGRTPTIDEAALDDSLASGKRLAGRLALEHLWPARTLRALADSAGRLGTRAWSR